MIIAVDFDGTIAKTRYPEIIELIPEAHYIIKWRHMGHQVILWTCRTKEPLQQAIAFCATHGLTFDAINANVQERIETYGDDSRKVSADYYLDDKCPMPVEAQWQVVNHALGGSLRKTVNANILKRMTARKG